MMQLAPGSSWNGSDNGFPTAGAQSESENAGLVVNAYWICSGRVPVLLSVTVCWLAPALSSPKFRMGGVSVAPGPMPTPLS